MLNLLQRLFGPNMNAVHRFDRISEDDWRREFGDAAAVNALIYLLSTPDDPGFLNQKAAGALGRLGDSRAIQPLIAVLKDERRKEFHRQACAFALGRFKDRTAVEALLETVRGHSEWFIRSAAIASLGDIGDTDAIETIAETLNDRVENVRQSAATALAKLGDQRGVQRIIERFETDAFEAFGLDAFESDVKCVAGVGGEIGIAAVHRLYHRLPKLQPMIDNALRERPSEIRNLVTSPAKENVERASKQKGPDELATQGSAGGVEQAVAALLDIYQRNPDGIYPGTSSESEARAIGQAAFDAGGPALMLAIWEAFAVKAYFMKRDLERVWSGIGQWQG